MHPQYREPGGFSPCKRFSFKIPQQPTGGTVIWRVWPTNQIGPLPLVVSRRPGKVFQRWSMTGSTDHWAAWNDCAVLQEALGFAKAGGASSNKKISFGLSRYDSPLCIKPWEYLIFVQQCCRIHHSLIVGYTRLENISLQRFTISFCKCLSVVNFTVLIKVRYFSMRKFVDGIGSAGKTNAIKICGLSLWVSFNQVEIKEFLYFGEFYVYFDKQNSVHSVAPT